MRLPAIQGLIKRRMLVNYRVDPAVMRAILPPPFEPKLHQGNAIAGLCLIRLEQMRPAGFPSFFGISSENAAHRVAVTWKDTSGAQQEGVFIPRRDTGSLLNCLAGGRIFPGEHHLADFEIEDDGKQINFSMRSRDGRVDVRLRGSDADVLPSSSCFSSMVEASKFFEGGSLGFSVTRDAGRLDALRLCTSDWRVRPLNVEYFESSLFSVRSLFPAGSVEFDHALMMRDIPHEWHQSDDMVIEGKRAEVTRTVGFC
ncbi:DUF2071 domain-containing protein [Verrucomicrobiota bacterium sgz303538]